MTNVYSCFVECPPRVPNTGNSERAVKTIETVSAKLAVRLSLNCCLGPTTHAASLMGHVGSVGIEGIGGISIASVLH